MSDLTTPLQSIIAQAAELPDSKQIKKYAQRIDPSKRSKVTESKVLILDISGSMGEHVPGGRKIEILKKAVSALDLTNYHILAFSSATEWVIDLNSLEPSGGTALHLALGVAAALNPRSTLVVSDGEPDDERQALAAAKKLTGTISTLYIGKDSNTQAIEFMRKLARLGCGEAYVQDLSKDGNPVALQAAIVRLLPAANS